MKTSNNKIWWLGQLVYKTVGVHPLIASKTNRLLLKMIGGQSYQEALCEHWSKRYGVHIFITVLTGVSVLKEGGLSFILYALVFNSAWHVYAYSALAERYRVFHLELMEGFFTFSTLYTLMVNAGLNQRFALEKCIGHHAFSPYLSLADQQIKSGMPEIAVYEEVASRFRDPLISRYFGCIIQGQRYGNRKLKEDLKHITAENWQGKLSLHRKAGEQLKAKLLLPLMLIFIGILLILVLPVIIQFNQIA